MQVPQFLSLSKETNKEHKACSKCKKIKEIKEFNKRSKSFRSECRECQSLDRINYLRRKRFKDVLFNKDKEIEKAPDKRKKIDFDEAFSNINIFDINNFHFISIPLVTQSEKIMGDPFSIIQLLKEKLKTIMYILALKRKFSISLLLKLSLINQKNEVFCAPS